ncbi:MAG: alpha/beta fold hydrolase [Pseudooceanicola sp.]
MTWAAILFGLAVAALVGPFLNELRKPRVTEALREGAPGRFAKLSQGITHYRWYDDKARGPVAVCVHGLTTPGFVWDGLAEELHTLGYRVLAYDLYGRGLSDRPAAPQTRHFFLRQLEDLLEHEGLSEDLTLFGYSMGGSIATCFAARHPHMLRRLVLVAPAGMGQTAGSFERLCAGLPFIGDWLFRVAFPARHRAGARKLHRDEGAPQEVTDAQAAQVDFRGFVPAVLSSRRRMLSETLETEHRKVARAGVPVLAIWAAKDAVIPLSNMGVLANWNRDAEQAQIDGASHWVPITHPRELALAFRRAVH